mgnify:CR=1 FL=1
MKVEHNLEYDGMELEVVIDFDEPEPEEGYRGGVSILSIVYNDLDITNDFTDEEMEEISNIIYEDNYK